MKTVFWCAPNGRMHQAEVGDDVHSEGRGVFARCRAAGCAGRIDAVDFEQWTETCENGHALTLPEKIILGDERECFSTLTRDGKREAIAMVPVKP